MANKIFNALKDNAYFSFLVKDSYEKYLSKPLVSSVKKCLSASKLRGVLSAYKLFYVGCSRAKKNLTVVVNKSKVESYEDQFVKKMMGIGFAVKTN